MIGVHLSRREEMTVSFGGESVTAQLIRSKEGSECEMLPKEWHELIEAFRSPTKFMKVMR
jgi:hypothetical protein